VIRSFPPHPNPLPPGERVGHSSPQQSWGVFWHILIKVPINQTLSKTPYLNASDLFPEGFALLREHCPIFISNSMDLRKSLTFHLGLDKPIALC
jgi:hypothetical protein